MRGHKGQFKVMKKAIGGIVLPNFKSTSIKSKRVKGLPESPITSLKRNNRIPGF